jgi:hypothetical protein
MEENKFFIRINGQIFRKTLYSKFKEIKKPYKSIKLCKGKLDKQENDPNRILIPSCGLLIACHPEERIKNKKEFFSRARLKPHSFQITYLKKNKNYIK